MKAEWYKQVREAGFALVFAGCGFVAGGVLMVDHYKSKPAPVARPAPIAPPREPGPCAGKEGFHGWHVRDFDPTPTPIPVRALAVPYVDERAAVVSWGPTPTPAPTPASPSENDNRYLRGWEDAKNGVDEPYFYDDQFDSEYREGYNDFEAALEDANAMLKTPPKHFRHIGDGANYFSLGFYQAKGKSPIPLKDSDWRDNDAKDLYEAGRDWYYRNSDKCSSEWFGDDALVAAGRAEMGVAK